MAEDKPKDKPKEKPEPELTIKNMKVEKDFKVPCPEGGKDITVKKGATVCELSEYQRVAAFRQVEDLSVLKAKLEAEKLVIDGALWAITSSRKWRIKNKLVAK